MSTKILICSIILTEINSLVYGSHLAFASKLRMENPDCDFIFVGPRRVGIDKGRNLAVEIAIQNNIDYVFFYDDDTDLAPGVLKQLLSRQKDAIGAAYFVRGYPFNLMAFEEVPFTKDEAAVVGNGVKWSLMQDFEDKICPDGLLGPLKAIGNGCSLIKTEVFRMVPKPWFKTGEHFTEDVYFYGKAHDHIANFEVWMDMNCDCGHMLDPIPVNLKNYKLLRKLYEELGYREEEVVWIK